MAGLAHTVTDEPLSRFLVEGGAVVAGGAALFGTVGFVAGALARDLSQRDDIDALRWADRGALFGGVFGLAALLFRA